jgi:hypothetical protein
VVSGRNKGVVSVGVLDRGVPSAGGHGGEDDGEGGEAWLRQLLD